MRYSLKNATPQSIPLPTFLYIRNDEQIYRLNCEMDFGDKPFPDRNDAIFGSEPMMVKILGGRVEKFIPLREWEAMRAYEDEEIAKYNAWEKANPGKSWIDNPHRDIGWCGGSIFINFRRPNGDGYHGGFVFSFPEGWLIDGLGHGLAHILDAMVSMVRGRKPPAKCS